MQSVARKARIMSGTEAGTKISRQFAKEEGLGGPSTRPKHPWNTEKKTGKRSVKSDRPQKAFDMQGALSKFKRTGELPSVPVETVKKASAEGLDARAIKRMISAMLVRSGVEENPGPPKKAFSGYVCANDGLKVTGEYVRLNRKRTLVCRLCHCKLTDAYGMFGQHPTEIEEDEVSSEPTPSRPASSAESKRPESAPEGLSGPAEDVESRKVPSRSNSPPPPEGDQVPNPPVPDPTVKSDCKAPVQHALAGHTLSADDEVAIMNRLVNGNYSPWNIEHSDIHTESITVQYKGERRLATCRNVQEIKQAFVARQMTVRVKAQYNPFYTAILVASLYGGILFIGFPVPVTVSLGIATMLLLQVTQFNVFKYFEENSPRSYSVAYVPHLVSSVMAEYDRGTNPTAARSTLRQKIRRLAALPIPDEDALKFIAGTELVCEQLLEDEDFFWEGAACFRQPQ